MAEHTCVIGVDLSALVFLGGAKGREILKYPEGYGVTHLSGANGRARIWSWGVSKIPKHTLR